MPPVFARTWTAVLLRCLTVSADSLPAFALGAARRRRERRSSLSRGSARTACGVAGDGDVRAPCSTRSTAPSGRADDSWARASARHVSRSAPSASRIAGEERRRRAASTARARALGLRERRRSTSRTTRTRSYGEGRACRPSAMRAGDLLFFEGLGHVGLYRRARPDGARRRRPGGTSRSSAWRARTTAAGSSPHRRLASSWRRTPRSSARPMTTPVGVVSVRSCSQTRTGAASY